MEKPAHSLSWLLAAAGLYVLSVGPALKISGSDTYFVKEPVRTIWGPVLALEHTVAGPAYRAYLRVWRVPALSCIW